jgi:hypothetical protein
MLNRDIEERDIGILSGEKHPISIIGYPVNIKHFCEATKGA